MADLPTPPERLPQLSPTIRATDAPPIPAARAWAARYSGAAGPALDLTQAVPGYPPPPELLARLGALAADPAYASYGPIDGEAALREALAADAAARYAAEITAADVAITAGGNLAFAMSLQAVASAGDAVLLPTPWYFNHRMALSMAGIAVVPLPCDAAQGFIPDPERAAALWHDRIRAVALVSPNNPTGATYPPDTIARFAALCRSRGAWLILDETYRDFLPGRAPPHALFASPAWRDQLIQLYSFSKAYCLPGHRIGAILAGATLRGGLLKAFDTWQICPPRPAQAALAWAIPRLGAWRAHNRDVMLARAAAFRTALAPLHRWRIDAIGAYFAYLRLPDSAPDALAAAETLAAEHGLLTLPGPFFGPGQRRHLRLAFANVDAPTIAAVPGRLAAAFGA